MSDNAKKEKLSIRSVIVNFLKDIYLTFHLIRDYMKGTYRDVSHITIVSIVGALIFMIASPIGYIPLLGQIDDIIVMIICLKVIQKDLRKYKQFRENHSPKKP